MGQYSLANTLLHSVLCLLYDKVCHDIYVDSVRFVWVTHCLQQSPARSVSGFVLILEILEFETSTFQGGEVQKFGLASPKISKIVILLVRKTCNISSLIICSKDSMECSNLVVFIVYCILH